MASFHKKLAFVPNFLENINILFLVILFCISNCSSFNVDTQNSIIITNLEKGLDFGATVALGISDKVSWVVIGAPKSNSTKQPTLQEPGLLFRCSLGSEQDNCISFSLDAPTGVQNTTNSSHWENKEEQLFGGSLAIGSDTFVSCASTWKSYLSTDSSSPQYMQGVCYQTKKDAALKKAGSSSNIAEEQQESIRLTSIVKDDGQDDKKANFGNLKRGWQRGLVGFSVHVPPNGSEILMGAPGVSWYRGTVVRHYNPNPTDPTDHFQKFIFIAPSANGGIPNTYFGYSVTSGRFLDTGSSAIQYVAGSPRSSTLKGNVTIFTFKDIGSTNVANMNTLWHTNGEPASYFGYSVCAVDVNGDGWDDLLVGAPHFWEERSGKIVVQYVGEIQRSKGTGDQGRVYVYLSDLGKEIKQANIKLMGNRTPWSQFGTAISNLGDINNDGYNDVAIGAPYEMEMESSGGVGAVYIYHGSPSGLQSEEAQVIYARDLDTSLYGFGFSLSQGLDIDNNGVNDFAVGAYGNNSAVVLRSSPLVNVTGTLTSSITSIGMNIAKFFISSCVQYSGRISQLKLTVDLEADVYLKPSRVLFGTTSNISYEHVFNKGNEACKQFEVSVKNSDPNSDSYSWSYSTNPVDFRQRVNITPKEQQSPDLPVKYQISTSGFSSEGASFSSFCSSCPLIDRNNSKWENNLQVRLNLHNLPCDPCKPKLSVLVEFLEMKNGNFIIGSSPTLTMRVTLSNSEGSDPSELPGIKFSWLRSNRTMVTTPNSCREGQEQGNVTCRMGSVLHPGNQKSIDLTFEMSDLKAGEQNEKDHLLVLVEGLTSGSKVDVSQTWKLPLKAQADLYIKGGSVTKEFNSETQLKEFKFEHVYEVTNTGPTFVKNVWFYFTVPSSIDIENNMPWEIVRLDDPSTSNNVHCQLDNSEDHDPDFDAENVQPSSTIEDVSQRQRKQKRRRRDLEDTLPKTHLASVGKLTRNNQVNLECTTSFVNCASYKCMIDGDGVFRQESLSFTFRMSMNTTTIRALLQHQTADRIKVTSQGRVESNESNLQPENHKPDVDVASVLITLESNQVVGAWVYAVSIVGGLILLICVAITLYMCGFFERKRPPNEEPDTGEHEKLQSPSGSNSVPDHIDPLENAK